MKTWHWLKDCSIYFFSLELYWIPKDFIWDCTCIFVIYSLINITYNIMLRLILFDASTQVVFICLAQTYILYTNLEE